MVLLFAKSLRHGPMSFDSDCDAHCPSVVMQVITVLRKLLGAEMKAKASHNSELRPQSSSTLSD